MEKEVENEIEVEKKGKGKLNDELVPVSEISSNRSYIENYMYSHGDFHRWWGIIKWNFFKIKGLFKAFRREAFFRRSCNERITLLRKIMGEGAMDYLRKACVCFRETGETIDNDNLFFHKQISLIIMLHDRIYSCLACDHLFRQIGWNIKLLYFHFSPQR